MSQKTLERGIYLMDKAIEKIEWLQDVFVTRREEQGFEVFVTIKDAFTEALEEIQGYEVKFKELESKYNQLIRKHDLICHDDCEHLCCLESGECYCEEQDCIRNYNDPSLYIDIYKDKYKQRN